MGPLESLSICKYSPKGWSISLLSSLFPAFLAWIALRSHTFGEYLQAYCRKSLFRIDLPPRSVSQLCTPTVCRTTIPHKHSGRPNE